MVDIKLKKRFKGYDYYTEDGNYFIKKEFNKFTLYDNYDEKIKDFETLKEVRECILLLVLNPYSFLHDCIDFKDYMSRCEKNITHFKLRCKNNSVRRYNYILNLSKIFEQIAERENLIISKSPHSTSFYAYPKDEYISWKHKPNNSYRLSNHWNWNDYVKNTIHCPTITNEDYKLCICKYINGYYYKI